MEEFEVVLQEVTDKVLTFFAEEGYSSNYNGETGSLEPKGYMACLVCMGIISTLAVKGNPSARQFMEDTIKKYLQDMEKVDD